VPELLDPAGAASSRSDTPSSSTAPRPESALSTGTNATAVTTATSVAGQLPVRKTRVAAPGQRKEPATRAPRVPKKPVAASAKAVAGGGSRPGSKAGSGSAPEGPSDGLDQITTGMRKIKLVTKAEREARERAKVEAARKAASGGDDQLSQSVNGGNTSSLSRQNSNGMSSTAAEEDTITVASSIVPSGPTTPLADADDTQSLPPLPVFATPLEPRFAPMPASSPMPVSRRPGLRSSSASPVREIQLQQTATPTTSIGEDARVADDALFVPYEPEGPAAVNVLATGQPLQWLPPNVTETPLKTPTTTSTSINSTTTKTGSANRGSAGSAAGKGPENKVMAAGRGMRPATPVRSPTPMKRADVPVFTATSAIPFAKSEGYVGTIKTEKEAEGEGTEGRSV
jgi:histone deacetylase HOS3